MPCTTDGPAKATAPDPGMRTLSPPRPLGCVLRSELARGWHLRLGSVSRETPCTPGVAVRPGAWLPVSLPRPSPGAPNTTHFRRCRRPAGRQPRRGTRGVSWNGRRIGVYGLPGSSSWPGRPLRLMARPPIAALRRDFPGAHQVKLPRELSTSVSVPSFRCRATWLRGLGVGAMAPASSRRPLGAKRGCPWFPGWFGRAQHVYPPSVRVRRGADIWPERRFHVKPWHRCVR